MHDLGIYNPHYIGSKVVIKNGIELREHFFNYSLLADEKELEKAVLARFPFAKVVSTSFNSQTRIMGITTAKKDKR